ncbi:S1 family peptidase [Corynebacterium coyleae]|uniref:S1 family peptidase n=1 Tax=Corynebacterium coyleae TaxID=53374 RepID=UPI00215335C0|nr:S1 family peptidase [Corynebacterium coyleae]
MTFPEHQAGGDNLAWRYQPEDGQQWRFPDMPGVPGMPAQPVLSAPPTQRRTGLRTGGWITVIVATLAAVAMVVWLGLTTSQFPTPTVEERHALERVQTPDEAPPAPVEESNVLVPAFAPWAPGTRIQSTDHYPEPGEHFTAQSCTAAFSFTGADGRAYAVTAGHCGRAGDLVWPTNAETAFDYAHEVGKFIYSGMYGDANEETKGIDVGIIEITDTERFMDVVGAPIATGIAKDLHDLDRVCKTGATTGYTCGKFEATQRVQIVNLDDDAEAQTHGDIASVCAASGDSGGPVFTEINGRATVIGVVSGTEAGRAGEECFEGMEDPLLMSYSNINQVMAVINHVVPDADLVPQRW